MDSINSHCSVRQMNKRKQPPIRVILLDFGGVIADEGFYAGLEWLARNQGLNPEPLPQLGIEAMYASGYVIGRGNEQDFWRLLRISAGITGSDAMLREEILSRFVVRAWALDLVGNLREAGYQTALLSDHTEWLDELDHRQGFLKEFDRVFVSYRLGKGKRDASLFDEVMESLGIAAEQAIFIDDNPGHVERAISRGLHGIVLTDRAGLETHLASLLETLNTR